MTSETLLADAIARHKSGRLGEAERLYLQVIAVSPYQSDANYNLGLIAAQTGRYSLGLQYIRTALEAEPTREQFLIGYIESLILNGRADLARSALEDAEKNGWSGSSFQNLRNYLASLRPHQILLQEATGFHQAGRYEEAIEKYKKSISIAPASAIALCNLGAALHSLGRLDEAVAAHLQALSIDSNFAEAECNLGYAFLDLGQLESAETRLLRALSIKPAFSAARYNLGAVHLKQGRLDEAQRDFCAALEIDEGLLKAWVNLGNVQLALGKFADAFTTFERAITLNPKSFTAHRSILCALTYNPDCTPEQSLKIHERFESELASPVYATKVAHKNEPDPCRRLRIGYISSDYRTHSAARNLLPLFRQHNRRSFEIFLYSEVARPDGITASFRELADGWASTVGLSDHDVAQKVQSDKIDILVCLAGRFDKNRPLVCAHRPAPIQISSHDVATSGLKSIDYIISDRILSPRNSPERFSERVIRLPYFHLGEVPVDVPPVNMRDGNIVFGSLNKPTKINDVVLDTWAQILSKVQDSTLILRFRNWYDSPSLRTRVMDSLLRFGVDPARVRYPENADSFSSHLKLYNEIDIALDTFPFSGSTTTFNSLIMGVPVIAFPSWSMVSRWSASMLTALNKTWLIANSANEYVRIAETLAHNRQLRRTLRGSLRAELVASPLCDSIGRARQYERIYRAVWRKWCSSQMEPLP